ncbi:MAG: hypothetical protein IKC54_01150 [Clostridia bacterium]|nr:hypothetical protein [Clostridia bacterium]
MNKKHLVSIIAIVALVAVLASVLVGCNKYEWTSIGGGNPNATVESNGGYYVKQGDYVYFINGYDTAETVDNTWGTPVKNSIVRAKLNADGTYSDAVVVVPKQVYNKDAKGGFAIFGEWIYYATPNNDKDKSGVASTTHTDFMRTKIDGSVTQLLATINSRTSQYFFTPTRILFKEASSSVVNFIDFSAVDGSKSMDNGKGVAYGTFLENVETILWDYNSEYIYFTETVTGDMSYEFCNTLNAIKCDGTDKKVLADKFTYLTEAEKENYVDYFPTKVFSYTLVDMVVENGGVALYYNKSNYVGSQEESRGLFVNKVVFGGDFNTATEKHLSKNNALSSVYALGYEAGALVSTSANKTYLVTSAEAETTANIIIGRAVTIQHVANGTVYYTDANGGKLYSISTTAYENEKVVLEAGIVTDWLSIEFVDGNVFFFDSKEYNYLHKANLANADDVTMLGFMNDADKTAKEEADKKAE